MQILFANFCRLIVISNILVVIIDTKSYQSGDNANDTGDSTKSSDSPININSIEKIKNYKIPNVANDTTIAPNNDEIKPPEQKKLPILIAILLVVELIIVISLGFCWALTAYLKDSPIEGHNNYTTKSDKTPKLELPKKSTPTSSQVPGVITIASPDQPLDPVPNNTNTAGAPAPDKPPDKPPVESESSAKPRPKPKVRAPPSDSSVNVETDLLSIKTDDKKDNPKLKK